MAMRGHYTSNWLGEPEFIPCPVDPDIEYERWRDEIETQNAIDAQLKLFPHAEQSARMESVA